MEFFTNVRLDKASEAWPSLARYLGRQFVRTNAATLRVQLIREWSKIDDPESNEDWELPYRPVYDNSYLFHSEEWAP